MPELPEVETIAMRLRNGQSDAPGLVGKTIDYADVFWDRTIETPDVTQFKHRIAGQTIKDIGRRAKYIRFDLSEDTMLIHLRMSGDVLVGEGLKPLAKHVRVSLVFTDGTRMDFNNPRKFGRIFLYANPEEKFRDLGPEPFDEALTDEVFHQALLRRKRQIKPLLLDQKFIAGVGNIYADESLNLSRVHPQRIAQTIRKKEASNLLAALREVLAEGIRRNGASIDWAYRGGEFQNQFRVYQQTGEPCPNCGTPISRSVVAQRSTHFCPRCQVLEE